MLRKSTRRQFLQTAAGGAVLGTGDLKGLLPLSPATAAEAKVTPDLVRFCPEVEPIVRLIEDTPQEKCIAMMIEQLRKGLPYRYFLAALYLSAIRAAKWHGGPHGFDHIAYVVHSVQQLSLDLPVAERLLPAFWALNGFKVTQQVWKNVQPTLALTGRLPSADQAVAELHAGMKTWDEERAERAIVAMIRSQGAYQVIEPLWHYAGRDWRFIGHIAILVANSWRLLQTIGWQHAEHVLRYVVGGLSGWEKDSDLSDQPYDANCERVKKAVGRLPANWAADESNEGLTKDLLGLIRDGKGEDACELAVRQLVAGKCQAGAVWDAVHLSAAELIQCSQFSKNKPWNGGALHANTASNALHSAFEVSAQPENRLLLLLQGLGWVHLFRDLLKQHGELIKTHDITQLDGTKLPDKTETAVEKVLVIRTAQPHEASRTAFALAQRDTGAQSLWQAAGRLLALKGASDVHDIKLFVAVREDVERVSPTWRPHLLAAGVYAFRGSDQPDHPVMQQVREAVRGL